MKFICLILFFLSVLFSYSRANNIDSLKNLVNSSQTNTPEIADAYSKISRYYNRIEYIPDSARKYGEIGLSIAQKLKYPQGIMKNQYHLGWMEHYRGNKSIADSMLLLAYHTKGINKEDRDFVLLAIMLGQVREKQTDYKVASNFYYEALSIAKKLNLTGLEAYLYHVMGLLYQYTNDYGLAVDFIKRSIHIYKQEQDSVNLFYVYNSLATQYNISEQHDSLRHIFPETMEYARKISNNFGSYLYMMMANVELKEKDYAKAIEYLDSSLVREFAVEVTNHESLGSCYFGYGNVYFQMENYREALEYYRKTIKHHRKITYDKKLFSASYEALGKCFEKLETSDSALIYSRIHHELSIELLKEQNSKEIARNEYNYKFQKQREEQLIQELELSSKIRSLRIIGIGMFVFVLIGLFIIYLLYINRKRKISEAKLKEDNLILKIENKEKEVTTNVLYLLKKNEFLSNITEKLQELNSKIAPENKAYMRQVINEIERNTFNDSWEEFEKRFQEVHVDFYKNISIEFPDLTPNELKISAFLKLNMSSKDISSITNQSVDSLKVARYRLRKKLGLKKGENLIAFLARF